MERVIEISNLTRDYGNGRGVFNLDFFIGKGEVFGLLGPNGAGKTTVIRHLMGFLRPQTGHCSIGGLDCWSESSKIQQKLGYIPGEINFFQDMTGAGFLDFLKTYKRVDGNGRMEELLERFELNPDVKIRKMSKGMKQKVGIVAAFMHDPEVLILDEPTSGLDPLMQNRFIELILEEKARGKTILMSSHIFEEVERTCHRVCIIREGLIAAIDSVDALKAAQVNKYVVTLIDEDAASRFAKEELAIESVSGSRVTVRVQNNIKDFIAAMSRHDVVNLSAPSQSLEEIFLQYYGGNHNV
ncbi:MAG: ABC transporter ATP-binding protein [Clostridiales bacterium]|nr:ABC transporter ATP-binding protein [Clostridiales bacterium]